MQCLSQRINNYYDNPIMDCYQKSNVFCQSQSFHKRLLSHYNLRANFLKLEQFLIKTPFFFFLFVNFNLFKKKKKPENWNPFYQKSDQK